MEVWAMIVTNPALLVSEAPTINLAEARRVGAELAAMIDGIDPDSPIALVLRNARRELMSLMQSAGGPASGTVIGPCRIAA